MVQATQRAQIRLARFDEVEQLRALGVEADRRYLDSAAPHLCDGTSIPAAAADQAIREQRLWVAVLDGAPDDPSRAALAGWICWTRLGGEFCIGQLSVALDAGRRGVGSALLERAHAAARERGEASVILATQRDVPWNAPWYAQRGYSEVAVDAWSDAMRALARQQQADGLDWSARVFMRRWLAQPSPGGGDGPLSRA